MDTLYKYVTAERALTCIPEVGDGTLRATQPAALNDPFECAVTTAHIVKDESEENRLLSKMFTTFNVNTPITEAQIHRARQEHGSLFLQQLFKLQVSTKFGVVSFASDPLHPLMWSHYTGDGCGFVIGYDIPQLSKAVSTDGLLRMVQYGERPPMFMGPIPVVFSESDLPAFLSLKSHHWSYENEWRLIVELDKTIGTGQTDRHDQPINLIRVPNEAVVSVHYTERTSPESVDLIRNRLLDANNRYGTKTLTKLAMSSTSYGYEEALG